VSDAQPSHRPERLLGSLLVAEGALSEDDIERVLREQTKSKELFGVTARRLGLVRDEQVFRALAAQYEFPIRFDTRNISPELFMAHDPFSARAEAIRSLRSELLLRFVDERRKVISIVSPRDGEGCSELAANLAIAFAQAGERTLLIDTNLRTPRQSDLFRMADGLGLSSLLSGRVSLKQAMSDPEAFDNLAMLAAGPIAPNPQELLGRLAFAYMMETLPASFDIVVVDTAPLLRYADAQIVAARAGACLISARANESRLNELSACKAKLTPLGVEIVGVVIND
jgi:chain length determinant protein tyrosine kinase EpsG